MKRIDKGLHSARSLKRNARGQALIEGVVSTWLIVTVSVAVLLLMLNVGIGIMYQEKINLVASAAAKHISQGSYFLGMSIPDDGTKLAARVDEAKQLASAMLNTLGMPDFNENSWSNEVSTVKINGGAAEAQLATVHFTVGGLSTIGSFFAPFALTASGISAESATPPPGTCTLHFRDVHTPTAALRNVRIPMYFCGIAGHPTDYPVCPKGTFVGHPVHAYTMVNADLYREDTQHPKITIENDGGTDTDVLPWWGYGLNGSGAISVYDPKTIYPMTGGQ